MVRVIEYSFRSLLEKGAFKTAPSETPRLVLHGGPARLSWVMIFVAVNILVGLPKFLHYLWREGERIETLVGLGGPVLLVVSLAIFLCERSSRWIVASPAGLTVTERTRERCFSWDEVRIEDLGFSGYVGAAPGTRGHFVDLPDGEGFTFQADTYVMQQFHELYPSWKKAGPSG